MVIGGLFAATQPGGRRIGARPGRECRGGEAGAAGRASRGIFRVHQFTKIEMFAYTLPGDSEVISQDERLSSSDTKIAPRSVRIASR